MLKSFENVDELESALSKPSDAVVETVKRLEGDILVLGAGGKMGPTLCRMIKTSEPTKNVLAVSRFSNPDVAAGLKAAGITPIKADLLDEACYAAMPDAPNIFFLAGMKFGATGNEPLTWAMNAYAPGLVCRRYPRSRIVVLSTGNVYPFSPVKSGGATEETPPGPVGEYAQSCLARERIFQYFSKRQTTPIVLVRLNYANEPRYGVIVDVARKIRAGEPVDLSAGYVNLIWQRDANEYIVSAIELADSPPAVLNLTGPETISVRRLAETIARELGTQPRFTGRVNEPPSGAEKALLSNASKCFEHFGKPSTPLDDMIRSITQWIAAGKTLLGKPTKFEVRNGKF